MSTLLRVTGAAVLAMAMTQLSATSSRADEACDNLVPYLWTFQPGMESNADPSWDGASQMNSKLHKGGHRLAAPGSVDHTTAYPYPNIPSAVSANLDRDTLNKVKGLYDRYVLLERSIEDTWKDRYAHNASSTGLQKFSSERNGTLQEMTHVAKSAKDEFVRFAFRNHSCFDQYEAYVAGQNKEMQQQLANTQATLRANEEIWAHAEAPAAVEQTVPTPVVQASKSEGVRVESIESGKRSPASATMPAIVPENSR